MVRRSNAKPASSAGIAAGGCSLASGLRASLEHSLGVASRSIGRDGARALAPILSAVRGNELQGALRHIDRAWRCRAEDARLLAPLYALLLMLEARDAEAALGLLQRDLGRPPTPDEAALIALALLRLGRRNDARRQIEAALGDYCTAHQGLLIHGARAVAQDAAAPASGWIGRGPDLQFVGEVSPAEISTALEIRLEGKAPWVHLLAPAAAGRWRPFRFDLPRGLRCESLSVSCRGEPLLGSGSRPRADFLLDGSAACNGRTVLGWARLGWFPERPVWLRLEDERGHRRRLLAGPTPHRLGGWSFEESLRSCGLHGARILVEARLPDRRWHPLPDSPLLLEPAVRIGRRRPRPWPAWVPGSPPRRVLASRRHGRVVRAPLTDVVVPVHGGGSSVLACIEAVLGTLDEHTSLLVVDDATADPALVSALDALAAGGRLTLLRNAVNQGFAASVNRALALHPQHDVVLLNSDTAVHGDWLPRLRKAAYSHHAVGTATPLSNNGSIASYPRAAGADMDRAQAPALHALAASSASGTSLEIPVGVGFCMYVRRDCLREVGLFDAAVFGKGYGEETDFCLRARRLGWSHRLASDVFVYHAGGLSFAGRRAALLDRSQRLLNMRHPGYARFIDSFLASDPLRELRRRLDERRLSAFDGRFVLLVSLALSGGVERFVNERCRHIRERGLFALVLKPCAPGDAGRCELRTDALDLPNLTFEIPAEIGRIKTLLGSLRLEGIEIQHFMDLDPGLLEAVRALPVGYEVFIHDYAWICPRVTLIGGDGRYCGEPAVSSCEACVARHGSQLAERLPVSALRRRSASWLHGARRVFVPSQDTAARLRRYFAGLTFEVRPHSSPVAAAVRIPLRLQAPVRIALIGAIGTHKGYRVLRACARDARARRLPLEFVVIGYTENDAPLLATGKVFITGRYTDGEVAHLIRREQPAIAWLPSVWPETWCYALDHALAAGLPVCGFDLGAIAERVRAAGAGALLPLSLQPSEINDRLLQFAHGTPRLAASLSAPRISDPDAAPTTQEGTTQMTDSADPKTDDLKQPEGLSASAQVLSLPPGLYLFSVRAAQSSSTGRGQLSLPAMHVAAGPGVPSGLVEFIAAPSAHGAWLFAAQDLLVARVNGPGATLILTSLRAPNGAVLSLKVERLNARAEVVPKTATPARLAGGSEGPDLTIPIEIAAHIRTRGDMRFTEAPWAGRVGHGLWIESFSLQPLERITAADIEYKALTGNGFETQWLSDGESCGTKGMAVPLIGFAARLKPGTTTAAYDCEYSGYFQSGETVGPLRNGSPCRSTVANDPLEGIQLRLVRRAVPGTVRADGTAAVDGAAGPLGAAADVGSGPAAPAAPAAPAEACEAPADARPVPRRKGRRAAAKPSGAAGICDLHTRRSAGAPRSSTRTR